jgi:hypothetical protein
LATSEKSNEKYLKANLSFSRITSEEAEQEGKKHRTDGSDILVSRLDSF